jgi:hypothetical protein
MKHTCEITCETAISTDSTRLAELKLTRVADNSLDDGRVLASSVLNVSR